MIPLGDYTVLLPRSHSTIQTIVDITMVQKGEKPSEPIDSVHSCTDKGPFERMTPNM